MKSTYGRIDSFRVIAALMIIAIHTYPFASLSPELEFAFTHVLARIAVPFFLMVTGYFILPQYVFQKSCDYSALKSFLKKTGLIYAGATLLYLPFSIYAGHYSASDMPVTILRNIVFDGTFYHLWYLPAGMLGVSLLAALGRKLSGRALLGIAFALYIFGLLGDSYYRVTMQIPFLKNVYDGIFYVSSYTRNGLFYAPIFLLVGAAAGKCKISAKTSAIGMGVSLALMLAEGMVLRAAGFQRHDSMYIALLPCMFFLFRFLLGCKAKASPFIRDMTMWVYILHPVFIIAVRGAARAVNMMPLLVDNSMVHYMVVTACSFGCAALIAIWRQRRKTPVFETGRAWIELDMQNLARNVDILRGLVPDTCELMPAIKANAYGHGAVIIGRALNKLGVYAFCVATVLEGVELRKNRVQGEILVLGYTHPEQFGLLKRYRLTQTVINHAYAQALDDYGKKLSVHIKIDTGMRRLGEKSEDIDEIIKIFRCKHIRITGIYTHMCADDNARESDMQFTKEQISHFNSVLNAIEAQGYTRPKVHLQSSYGILNHPEPNCDYVRPGIALYGMLSHESHTAAKNAGLRPVLSLKARISMVKTLRAGESLGYGRAFTAAEDTCVAMLSIGYADGIPRSLSCGVGKVLINGCRASVVGRVCMDQMAVDITGIDGVNQGDVAVIIGKSGEEEITACEIAEQTGTISNEILSRLSAAPKKSAVRLTWLELSLPRRQDIVTERDTQAVLRG